MANNNQLSYQTATIDPTIAGYAARDPGFALGLLLGRGWVENYNERGIRKLQESLKGKDGLTPADANADAAATNTAGSTPAANAGTIGTTDTAASASADNAQKTPQIFSANQNPVMAQVEPYKITPMAVQPSDVQRAVMEKAVADNATPQAGDAGYKDALMARVRNILYDPNNQWAQSAARGAIYNKLKAMGDPGGGNPYAIGNYDDPSQNFSQQALAQSFANKWTPQSTMNADGTVTQNPAPGYVANNPLQGASMYAMQGNANQGIQSPDMAAQFRAYLNGETPQTAPVLDAVQAAQAQQAATDNTQNVIPPQAKTANFTDAEQGEKSDEPVQQEQTSQEEKPVVSKLETTATEQNSQNGKTVQYALQNNVQPTPLKPFSVKDWIAQVTQAGIAQGRPMNQIQAVISRGLPAAQAAEDNYKKQAVDGLLNRIYNGDETTGGKNLLPTMENANTTVPKLMQTLNEIDSIDPERGTQIRAILPSYNTFLKENISNFNKARDVGYSIKLSDHSMENNIKQHERLGQFDDERTKNMAKWKHAMSVAWKNQDLADRANLISKYSNGQITPDQAMGMLLGLGGKGSGVASGDVQKTSKGTLVINGNELSKTQTARSNELDANLRRMSDELKGYMANSTADDIKNGDGGDNLAKSIDALNAYISGLDDKDRALIPNSIWDGLQQQLYAANYIRENLAGNGKMENAIEYLKALTPETRQMYNIITE